VSRNGSVKPMPAPAGKPWLAGLEKDEKIRREQNERRAGG
jgi:hypothetical protein